MNRSSSDSSKSSRRPMRTGTSCPFRTRAITVHREMPRCLAAVFTSIKASIDRSPSNIRVMESPHCYIRLLQTFDPSNCLTVTSRSNFPGNDVCGHKSPTIPPAPTNVCRCSLRSPSTADPCASLPMICRPNLDLRSLQFRLRVDLEQISPVSPLLGR
jgi:hypothetical protein